MRHTLPTTVRRGFTLVELLVAAALCVLVMYVLAEAFKAGTDTLSQLKSVAGLADQLRVAETIIRRDLKEQHLEDKDGNAVLVSDDRFALTTPTPPYPLSWATPNRGYFRVIHGSKFLQPADPGYANATYKSEGSDTNGIPSGYATDHWMQFTCKLTGKTTTDVFIASAPPTLPTSAAGTNVATSPANMVDFATLSATNGGLATFAGKWGEVTYYLKKSSAVMPEMPNPSTPTKPLHVLYRRARVMAPPSSGTIVIGSANVNALITGTSGNRDLSGYIERPSSGGGDNWIMNTPDKITDPQFRLGNTFPIASTASNNPPIRVSGTNAPGAASFATAPAPFATADNDYGADILLANVVSMRIQVLNAATLAYDDVGTTSSPATWPLIWDTYLTNDTPPRIRGVRVQLRVYDTKNMVTRQITIDQPL